jgi:hypothetical protein
MLEKVLWYLTLSSNFNQYKLLKLRGEHKLLFFFLMPMDIVQSTLLEKVYYPKEREKTRHLVSVFFFCESVSVLLTAHVK